MNDTRTLTDAQKVTLLPEIEVLKVREREIQQAVARRDEQRERVNRIVYGLLGDGATVTTEYTVRFPEDEGGGDEGG